MGIALYALLALIAVGIAWNAYETHRAVRYDGAKVLRRAVSEVLDHVVTIRKDVNMLSAEIDGLESKYNSMRGKVGRIEQDIKNQPPPQLVAPPAPAPAGESSGDGDSLSVSDILQIMQFAGASPIQPMGAAEPGVPADEPAPVNHEVKRRYRSWD